MTRIDYYFSFLSPWAYLAGTRLEEIAARRGAEITYKPFSLVDAFDRTGGVPLPRRHESRQQYRLQELRRAAKKRGMEINPSPAHWPTNPAPASYAAIAAQSAGGGDMGALCHGLLRASWVEEKDIADDGVIADCLEAAGFPRGLAMSGMVEGAAVYARNLEDAVAAGAFGSPFYITDSDERFWGQDRLDDLDMHLAGEL